MANVTDSDLVLIIEMSALLKLASVDAEQRPKRNQYVELLILPPSDSAGARAFPTLDLAIEEADSVQAEVCGLARDSRELERIIAAWDSCENVPQALTLDNILSVTEAGPPLDEIAQRRLDLDVGLILAEEQHRRKKARRQERHDWERDERARSIKDKARRPPLPKPHLRRKG